MSLVNLLTDQAKFTYYYGGKGNFTQKNIAFPQDSNQPYVNVTLNTDGQIQQGSTSTLIEILGGNPAGSVSNILGQLGSDKNQEKIRDVKRISSFLLDYNYSPVFIAKQVGLQLMNPKIEIGKTLGIERTRIYNSGINTLTQVVLQGYGEHIERHGLIPNFNVLIDNIESLAENKDYENTVKKRNKEATSLLYDSESAKPTNRLITLYNESIIKDKENEPTTDIGGSFNVLSGLGGPDSFLGLGRTDIVRYDDTSNNIDRTIVENILNNDIAFNPKTYITFTTGMRNRRANEVNTGDIPIDFRQYINNYVSASVLPAYKTEDYIVTRLNYSNPGILFNRRDIKNTSGIVDKLATDENIYTSTNFYSSNLKDLIKFRFESIYTDTPSKSRLLTFRAYLDGGITDSYNPQWQSYQYVGRAEDFYTYSNFKRDIKFSFKIAAQSREELMPLYNKLNALVSNTAPDLVKEGSLMRGPIMRLTIGDYLFREYGFINSLTLNIEEQSPWEVNLESDSLIGELPHVINVSVGYTIIHKFLPSKNRRFINNTNGGKGGSEQITT